MTRTSIIVGVVLFLAAFAFAADVVQKYPSDATASFGQLTAISAADVAPLDSSDYSSRQIVILNHNRNLTLSASFSASAATASVAIIRGRYDLVNRVFTPSPTGDGDWGTFSADSTYTVGGRYVSKSSGYDTSNTDACMIYVRSISSGNVLVGWRIH